MAKPRLRRKPDGTVELPESRCPICGTNNFGVNVTKGSWFCWRCSRGGPLTSEEKRGLGPALAAADPADNNPSRGTPTTTLPAFVRRIVEARGADPSWLELRYGVRWTGDRLHWPAGEGASLRAVWPWQSPKTLTVAPRGLIGQHLLRPGARVVVTEGDYKAAAIPLPWVGVGVMGAIFTEEQAGILSATNPAEVVVMLDGGFCSQANKVAEQLALLRPRVVALPDGKGPDDVARGTLYQMLMEAA